MPEEGFYSYSPADVQELIQSGGVQVVDVRDLWEYEYCRINGSIHIPLTILPLRLNELNKQAVTVVLCHHGNRSYFAGRLLEREGFRTIINLQGGIDHWAKTVDTSVPTY